jgi:hypothetical protein
MKSGSARRAVLAASSRVWPGCRPPRAGLAGEPRRRHVPWLSRERRRRASPHYGRRAGARPRRRRGRSRRDLAPRCTDTRLLGVRRLGRCRGDRHSQRRVRRQRPPATRPRTRNYRWPSVFRHHTALVEFIPRAPSETRVVHIRPVYDDTRSPQSRRSWFSESDGQSRVLATLGTVNNRNQLLLTKLLEAVAGEDCQVLLARRHARRPGPGSSQRPRRTLCTRQPGRVRVCRGGQPRRPRHRPDRPFSMRPTLLDPHLGRSAGHRQPGRAAQIYPRTPRSRQRWPG